MCNINIFIKTEEESLTEDKHKDFLSFFSSALNYSFISNYNGEGLYFDYDNALFKSDKKINILNYEDLIRKSNFIITHQRLSTSGFNTEYHHPFINNDFVLVHNGILNSFKIGYDEKTSDSFGLFCEFEKEFKKNCLKKSKNKVFTNKNFEEREKAIIKSIKNLFEGLKEGWYSIGIYDIKTKKLYYFKDNLTKISLFRNQLKTEIYLTTEKDNRNFLEFYSNDFKEIVINPFKIYSISINQKNKITLKIIGEIKKKSKNKVFTNKNKWNYPYISGYGGFDFSEEVKQKPKTQTNLFNGYTDYYKIDEIKSNMVHYCSLCNDTAEFFSNDYGYLCSDCFIKEYGYVKEEINN